jgi:hypothetical protein
VSARQLKVIAGRQFATTHATILLLFITLSFWFIIGLLGINSMGLRGGEIVSVYVCLEELR